MDLMDVNLPLLLLTVSLTVSIGLLVAAVRQPSPIREAQQLWSAGLIAAPLGMVLLKLSEHLDVTVVAVIAKTTLTAAFVACLLALGNLTDRRPALKLAFLPVVAVPLASVLFVFQHPGAPMRTGLLSLICAAICLGTAWLGWSRERSDCWRHARIAAALFGIGALLLSVRAALLFASDAPTTAAADWLLAAGVLVPPLATVGFALACGERLAKQLERLVREDELTGLWTRRAFMDQARRSLLEAGDRDSPVALLAVDVDDFKQVNDQFGHQAGDQALAMIASALKTALREQDHLGRIGGDEFAVLLVGANAAQGQEFVRRLHDAVTHVRFAVDNVSIPLRISVGMASTDAGASTLGELMERADRAMYDHKRNRSGGRLTAPLTALPDSSIGG